ncbi:hypothetical protein [Botrimarina colliarenosi]|uniref:hypothetical protein n=1 Tax=Botrimarina colliarenosi TaxID=2528001 RepID=UPI0011B6ADF5|nr:hypothetical protein [Botrimarina colliarenosi]
MSTLHYGCNRTGSGTALLGLLAGLVATPAAALNGQTPLGLATLNGWKAIEILSQGDSLAGVADPGFGSVATHATYDGLGIYPRADSLSVWINHETSQAAITRVELDPDALRQQIEYVRNGLAVGATTPVIGAGFAYETIFDGGYDAQSDPAPVAVGPVEVAAYGAANFSRFCSGTSHHALAFDGARGFVDSIYLTGEEVNGGYFYALDEATRTLWEATDLGRSSWENAAAVDTGETAHVALILSPDVGSGVGDYIRLYVGEKGIDANADGEIDFLERNGLRGGTTYLFKPSSGSKSDLPDGTVSGFWTTIADAPNALLEKKLEDVHTNPRDGTEVVLGAQLDGVYRMKVDLTFTESGDFDRANSPVSLTQIDDNSTAPIGAPDNVTWSYDGMIYVQEDGDGDGIFQIDRDGGSRVQIAAAGSEPSGVIDASIELGYQPGSVLMTSLQGSGSSGAQLGLLISPDAAPLLPGDYDLDGDADLNDLAAWQVAYGSTGFSLADGNRDGSVNAADYTVWRDAYANNAVATPEGASLGMAALGLVAAGATRRRRARVRRAPVDL